MQNYEPAKKKSTNSKLPSYVPVEKDRTPAGLGNKKITKKILLGVAAVAVVTVLTVVGVKVWSYFNIDLGPNGVAVSRIKFNTDFNATVMDLKLDGKSVAWDNPCGRGDYFLDPVSPYILCDTGMLYQINPDGSNTPIDGVYTSNRIRYGIVILPHPGNDENSFYDVEKKHKVVLPQQNDSRLYFLTSDYLLRVYQQSSTVYVVEVVDRTGKATKLLDSPVPLDASQIGANGISFKGKGFFPAIPEVHDFIINHHELIDPLKNEKVAIDKAAGWAITTDGAAVFSHNASGNEVVTTYDKYLKKIDSCVYPKPIPKFNVRPEQSHLKQMNLLSNQDFINYCNMTNSLENTPLSGTTVIIQPDGEFKIWKSDKDGIPSFNSVSHPVMLNTQIAGFFDHGNQLVINYGDVINPGRSGVIFKVADDSKPVDYAYNKGFFIMGNRLWELTSAN